MCSDGAREGKLEGVGRIAGREGGEGCRSRCDIAVFMSMSPGCRWVLCLSWSLVTLTKVACIASGHSWMHMRCIP